MLSALMMGVVVMAGAEVDARGLSTVHFNSPALGQDQIELTVRYDLGNALPGTVRVELDYEDGHAWAPATALESAPLMEERGETRVRFQKPATETSGARHATLRARLVDTGTGTLIAQDNITQYFYAPSATHVFIVPLGGCVTNPVNGMDRFDFLLDAHHFRGDVRMSVEVSLLEPKGWSRLRSAPLPEHGHTREWFQMIAPHAPDRMVQALVVDDSTGQVVDKQHLLIECAP